MEVMESKFRIVLALAVLAVGEGRAEGLEMQVEEPVLASPPIDPTREAGTWKGSKGSSDLSQAQKQAIEARRRLVEAMASEVHEKREALRNSTDAERAARVKELELFILEPALDADRLEKLEKRQEKHSDAKTISLERKLEEQKGKKEKSIEKNQEKLDKEKEALDRQKSGGNSGK